MHHLYNLKSKQRGLSFVGMLFVAAVLGILFIVGAKVLPTIIEYQSIQKAVNSSKDAESVAAIRTAFDKNKATGYFEAVSGKDLVIEKVADRNVVSFAYTKEIELVDPVYLTIKYAGKTK
jgi:uncharacterized protein (DUF3084 family)